jgi:hypothetical protein
MPFLESNRSSQKETSLIPDTLCSRVWKDGGKKAELDGRDSDKMPRHAAASNGLNLFGNFHRADIFHSKLDFLRPCLMTRTVSLFSGSSLGVL